MFGERWAIRWSEVLALAGDSRVRPDIVRGIERGRFDGSVEINSRDPDPVVMLSTAHGWGRERALLSERRQSLDRRL